MERLYLLYHELRQEQSSYSYVTRSEEFEAHCGLYARLQRKADPAMLRPEITFDDGHVSDATIAAPILAGHGLLATFFVTAGWTERRAGFMTWQQLRQLRAQGHHVGAHGMTHSLLTGCSDAVLHEELQGARQRLEDGLGEAVRSMSLPGGRTNGRVLRACQEAGFERIFTSLPRSTVLANDERGVIGRLNLVGNTSVPWLERVLLPRSGALQKLERTAQVKHAAKMLLGDTLYAKLWSVANRQERVVGEPGMESR